MSRNLKDIVDDGFAKLNSLAERRKEILKRTAVLSHGETDLQDNAVVKLKDVEHDFTAEMNQRSEQAEEFLRQTLAQIAEDNERYLDSVQQSLKMRVSKILKEIAHGQSTGLLAASERLDALMNPLERELAASSSDLRMQATRLLGDLESACNQSQSALHLTYKNSNDKLRSTQNELIAKLDDEYNKVLDKAFSERGERLRTAADLTKEQSVLVTKLDKELDDNFKKILDGSLKDLKALEKEIKQSLKQANDGILKDTVNSFDAKTDEWKVELQESYDFSRQELDDKLAELKQSSDLIAEDLRRFFASSDDDVRAEAAAKSDRMKMSILFGTDIDSADISARNPLADFPQEMKELAKNFKDRLQKLNADHSEKLTQLVASTEASWKEVSASAEEKLQEALKEQGAAWTEKEEKLGAQIDKLEQTILELCAGLAESAEIDLAAEASVGKDSSGESQSAGGK